MTEEIRMDDLFNDVVDIQATDKVLADLLLPPGSYTTIPKLSRTVGLAKVTALPEGSQFSPSLAEQGRRSVRYFGPIKLVTALGVEIEGRIGFNVSPDEVRDKEGKPDHQSRLWAQAVKAYQVAAGRAPESSLEVLDFLQDYPYRVRVVQVGVATEQNPNPRGEPGNVVMNISALVER